MTPEDLVRRLIKTIKRLGIKMKPDDIKCVLGDREYLIDYRIPLEENILIYVSRKEIYYREKDEISMRFSKIIFNTDNYKENLIMVIRCILRSKFINKNLSFMIKNNFINTAYALSRTQSRTFGYNNPVAYKGNILLSLIYRYNSIRLAYDNMDDVLKSSTELSVLSLIRKNYHYSSECEDDFMYLYFSMEDTIYKE